MTPYELFRQEGREEVSAQARDPELAEASRNWLLRANARKYSYHFEWLGRPIIQYPQDMLAMQELVWQVRPDLIIETGIAHGGSLILSASMLALLDYCDAAAAGRMIDPGAPARRVLAVDIDIRSHNRAAIESHPLAARIDMIQGSSIDPGVIENVRRRAEGARCVLVCLDSNHTHDHVLAELEAYAGLVTPGSYCCVFDTVIEDMPADAFQNRPWGPGNSPKTAVREYLAGLARQPRKDDRGRGLRFEIDGAIQDKLLITVAPEGYLRRLPDVASP
jgi:cephalosporin hydroxylase